MADVAWILFQVLLLIFKSPQKRGFFFVVSLYFVILAPALAVSNRSAIIDIHRHEKFGSQPRLSVSSSGYGEHDLVAKNVIGRFAEIGNIKHAEGRLHLMPKDCNDDEKGFARLPEDWVAVFHYGERSGSSADNLTAKCSSVIDRVQKALMFGASAIIILSLNPKILKELDARQMFSCPVIIVDAVENVTNFVNVLKSKMKIKAKIFQSKVKQNYPLPTLTLWATCGRPTNGHSYHEWDGVVCLGNSEQREGKADPTSFWNFFYSGVFLLLMLLAIKARLVGDNFGETENEIEVSLRHLAHQALSVMKTRKYKHDSRYDICAVCLEKFFPKQKLRVLPCLHEFHTKCVDPWLVKNRTCPLCKLNIVEDSSSLQDTSGQ